MVFILQTKLIWHPFLQISALNIKDINQNLFLWSEKGRCQINKPDFNYRITGQLVRNKVR